MRRDSCIYTTPRIDYTPLVRWFCFKLWFLCAILWLLRLEQRTVVVTVVFMAEFFKRQAIAEGPQDRL